MRVGRSKRKPWNGNGLERNNGVCNPVHILSKRPCILELKERCGTSISLEFSTFQSKKHNV